MKRISLFTCSFFVAAFLVSCGGPSAEAERAETERVAEVRERLASLESGLAGSPDRVEFLRSILGVLAMELDDPKAAIDRFESEETALNGDRMARVYLAVAQCKMAGVAEKIERKMGWLAQGMATFDALREEFPDDETVYLYQASTYAYFPAEVGAKAEVLDLLADMRDRYRSGEWPLNDGTAAQLARALTQLGAAYPDAESAAEIEEAKASFRSELPAFAAAEGEAAEAARE